MDSRISNAHSPDWHRALFVVQPPEPIARRIAGGARHERRIRGLRGKPIDAERLHITLFYLGTYDGGLPIDIVSRATEAASLIAASPFPVTFDRLLSFRNGSGQRPLVLTGGNGVKPLQAFWQSLAIALVKARLKSCVKSRITPHITLLRDACDVEERDIAPIGWTVKDFALIDSLVGKSRHVELGRWKLQGSSMAQC